VSSAEPTWLQHHRIRLALHRLAPGRDDVRPLLLLHGLGESTPDVVPSHVRWPGPVLGLDFTGHGRSTVPTGGGYTAEILVADVDTALEHVGPVTVVGRGLGAYIGMLAAAARPETVRGVALVDGPGLAGGGTEPGSPSIVAPPAGALAPPDPFALVELARDPRPPSYAQTFVRFLLEESDLDEPIVVDTSVRPPWIRAVLEEPGVVGLPLAVALERYASVG
jgi:pimeloyl-ACP methyl ester carboxylesterase